jgi:hypothetical protein
VFPQIINNKVYVPMRAEGPNGLIGDGLVELLPTDPDYLAVRAWIETQLTAPTAYRSAR